MSIATPPARAHLLALIVLALVTADLRGVSFWDNLPDEELIDRLVAEMTPEELVAQTLLVAWEGEPPSPAVMEWIDSTTLGGVKVFGWNGVNLPTLVRSISTMQRRAQQHRLQIPLFTATDQEGGWVRHVKGTGELTTSVTPGNMAIGASGLPSDAYWSGYYIGMELRALGINMNFAPTVDVYINPEAHVIGPRAFSSDPVASGILGVSFFHGLEEARVMATAKHFPGHGNADGDSHGVLPEISDTIEELRARDLVPFRFLIQEGVPAVLSGHLAFPNITNSRIPASLSHYFKQELLREELGFEGIVITDDLYMQGAWEYDRSWGIEQIIEAALRAGSDIILLSRTPARSGSVMRHLMEVYQEDGAFREQVELAVRNILRVKLDYLKADDRVPLEPDVASVDAFVSDDSADLFFRDQAARGTTVVAGRDIPFTPDADERVLVVSRYRDVLTVAREFYPTADTLQLRGTGFYTASSGDRDAVLSALPRYDTVIFALSDPNTLQILRDAEAYADRITVLSLLTPIYLYDVPWVDSAVAVYGSADDSIRAGFSALSGSITAGGRLPVFLDTQDDR